MTKQLLMATYNRGKLLELEKMLEGLPVEILTLASLPSYKPVAETGHTFLENAVIKAVTAAKESGILTLADDSGLEVDALNGQPGVHSARFAGEPPDDHRNNTKLLQMLAGIPPEQRTARFVSAVAIAIPDRSVHTAEGRCEGVILTEGRGEGGFGYDPLFYVPALQKTFAELSLAEKNRFGHRGEALRKAAAVLHGLLGPAGCASSE